MVTLGTAVCADTLPSPSLAGLIFAVAVSEAAVGVDGLPWPQAKSVSATAPIVKNRRALLCMVGTAIRSA
jgi:hypothetical protein